MVIESESLARWRYADPERDWGEPRPRKPTAAISKPFSEYWLNNQGRTDEGQGSIGSEEAFFIDELTIYTRLLDWGVVVRQGDNRLLQTFSFAATKLRPDGAIDSPRIDRKWAFLSDAASPLPINIGEVQVRPTLPLNDGETKIDALERVRSVDVVYLAAGGKQSRKGRSKLGLGRFAIPKLRTNIT